CARDYRYYAMDYW
nr:immunoglobulin heavy chain junction region [Mus musculus]